MLAVLLADHDLGNGGGIGGEPPDEIVQAETTFNVPPMCWAVASGLVLARPAREGPALDLEPPEEDGEPEPELPPDVLELEPPHAATAIAHTLASTATEKTRVELRAQPLTAVREAAIAAGILRVMLCTSVDLPM